MKISKELDEECRKYAAKELLEVANDWQADVSDDEEHVEEISEDIFIRRLKLIDSMSSCIDNEFTNEFTLLYDDDDMFFGHMIQVSGNLDEGPSFADLLG